VLYTVQRETRESLRQWECGAYNARTLTVSDLSQTLDSVDILIQNSLERFLQPQWSYLLVWGRGFAGSSVTQQISYFALQ